MVMGGVAAGAVHMLIQMAYEGMGGSGIWTPLAAVAAVLLRDLQADPTQGGVGAVLLGIILHFAVSIGLAWAYAAFAPFVSRRLAPLLGLGLAWGMLVYLIARFIAIPLVNPAMLVLDQGFLLLAHLGWGLTVGMMGFWIAGTTRPRYVRERSGVA